MMLEWASLFIVVPCLFGALTEFIEFEVVGVLQDSMQVLHASTLHKTCNVYFHVFDNSLIFKLNQTYIQLQTNSNLLIHNGEDVKSLSEASSRSIYLR